MPDKIFRRKVIIDIDEEETARIRKSWFQHIFNNIERLTADLYSSKESFNNKLNKAREEHFTLKDDLKTYVDKAIDKLKVDLKEDLNKLNQMIESINTSMKVLEGKLTEHEIRRISEAKAAAETINTKIGSLRETLDSKITPVSKEVWLSKGKLATWATILGLLVAAIVTYIARRF